MKAPGSHLKVVFGIHPLGKDAGAAVGWLYAEGALRNPHALLATDARAFVLRRDNATSWSRARLYKV